jgi:predicted enzyme related to lactoylglutathione lyase
MPGKVMHFEIHGRDDKRTQQFYASLFDWKIDANNPMQYGIVAAEAPGIGGGICKSPAAPMVTFYVAVPDLKAALAKATSLGGKTIMEPNQVPGGPEIAMFADPDGNQVGLLKDPTA